MVRIWKKANRKSSQENQTGKSDRKIKQENPNVTFYKWERYMSVFKSAIINENIEVLNRMCNFGLTEKKTHGLMFCAIVNKSISVIKYFIAKNIDLNFHMLSEFSETCPTKMMKSSLNFGIEAKGNRYIYST